MKKLKKKIPPKIIHIIFGVVLTAVGIFALIFPDSSLMTVCTITGLGTLIFGIIRLARYIADKRQTFGRPRDLISGIMYLILASALLMHPKFLLSFLPFFIGISVLLYGISSFLASDRGIFSKIVSIAVIIFGFSLMFNPYKGATAITSFIGFGLVIWGIITIVAEILTKAKSPHPKDDNGYTEVEFRDV